MVKDYNNFRNIGKMNTYNDGTRTLYESIMLPELILAMDDWKSNNIGECVLIGGIALSHYVKPRMTQDIDLLFLTDNDIPDSISKFKRHRPHAFQHNKTHVEIEVITPSFINLTVELAKQIIDTAIISDGMKIASPSGLIASKLGRFNRQDQADIESLLKTQKVDISTYSLTDIEIQNFFSIKNDI